MRCFKRNAMIVVLALILATSSALGAEYERVRVGITPYTMYQIWWAAEQLGIDREFGIELELVDVAQSINGIQLMIRGDLDITAGTPAEHLPIVNQAPQVKNFSTVGFFKGFIFVGRKGEIRPFDELVAEYGLERAKEIRLNEFRGKSFAIIPQRKPLIADALAQVGIGIDEVQLLNFADDQKAATAFLSGTGDFYIGSLPQERRLLSMEDRFVNAGGSEVLGPAGLWYDTMLSTPAFMENRREAALRTLALWYRLVEIWDRHPEILAPIAAESLSRLTGGDFSVEEYITLQTVYDDFLSVTEVLSGFYNPLSELYWKYPVDYYIGQAIEAGDLPDSIRGDEYFIQSEELFYELLTRPDLLQKIFAPISAETYLSRLQQQSR